MVAEQHKSDLKFALVIDISGGRYSNLDMYLRRQIFVINFRFKGVEHDVWGAWQFFTARSDDVRRGDPLVTLSIFDFRFSFSDFRFSVFDFRFFFSIFGRPTSSCLYVYLIIYGRRSEKLRIQNKIVRKKKFHFANSLCVLILISWRPYFIPCLSV